MGEVEEGKKMGMTDNILGKIVDYLTEKVSTFVSFLFVLFGVGMLIGRYVVVNFPRLEFLLILVPFVLAIIAYYNRTFAIIAFIIFLAVFIV